MRGDARWASADGRTTLTATWTRGVLRVELAGVGAWRVNTTYPALVAMTARGTTVPTVLRRAEATRYEEAGAVWEAPATEASGAAVRGVLWFAVCSAESCAPEQRAFVLRSEIVAESRNR